MLFFSAPSFLQADIDEENAALEESPLPLPAEPQPEDRVMVV